MKTNDKLRTDWLRTALISVFLMLVMMAAIGSAGISYADDEGGGEPVSKLELVGFDEDGWCNMGKLQKGYTKAEARDLKTDIKVVNSGETTLNIDPSAFILSSTAEFTYSSVGEATEIKPGEIVTIGWVQPRHQMDTGYHYTRVSFHDADYTEGASVSGSIYYVVVSEDCDVLVTRSGGADQLSSVDLGTEAQGYVKGSTAELEAVNMTTSGVRFSYASDSELFSIEPKTDPETVVGSLQYVDFDVAIDGDTAASLGIGEYTGSITVTATLENGEEVDERVIPVSYRITGAPCWQDEEVTLDVSQDYWYESKTLHIKNFEIDHEPKYDFLRVEVKEGAENFEASIAYSYNEARLRFKNEPEPGTYDVLLDLYFDSEGKRGEGDYCGTCKVKVNVEETGKYDLKIVNGEADDGDVTLGTLLEGYGEEEAAAIGQKLIVKNTGKENLEMSRKGLEFIDDGEKYLTVKCSSEGSKTVRPGKEYTAISFQPKTGLKPGSYEVDISFKDDEGKAKYGDNLYIYFDVVEDGMQLDLIESGGIFDPDKPIGKDGLDLGIFSPDPEAKDKNTYIEFSNTGSVDLNVTASIEDDENGIFSLNKDSAAIKSTYYTNFRLTAKMSEATEPGVYTAVMKVTAKNADDETEQINIDVPIKLTISNDNKCKITVDFQGKGDGEYENTTMEFVKGTTYSKALTEIMRKVMNVSYGTIPWPTDDDYTMIALTFKKDGELKDWDDTQRSQKEVSQGVAQEDKTIYVNWAKKIDKVAFNVDVPKCGEPVGNVIADIPEGAHYTLVNGSWNADEEDMFMIGRSYGYDVRIAAEFGYAFSKDAVAFINGKRAVNNTAASDTMHMDLSGKAEVTDHLYGDAVPAGEKVHILKCPGCGSEKREEHVFDDGVVTTEPTCDEYGEVTYTCESCGYEEYELEDPLGHEWKTEVVTKTDDEKWGLIEGECERCKEGMQDSFIYSCTEGNDQTWYQGSDKSVRFNFERFDTDDEYEYENNLTGIRIDDKVYPVNDPARSYGITIFSEIQTEISIYGSILKELDEGSHKFTCLFEDGESDIVKFNVVKTETIDAVDVMIQAPVCGESASRVYNERKGTVITNPPVVTLVDGAPYTVDMSVMNPPYWTDEKVSAYWSGTFKGGETYYAFFCLKPADGYVFSKEEDPEKLAVPFKGTVKVNGKEVTPIKTASFVDNMRFIVPIEAEHDWDEVVTKEPTYKEAGSKDKTCKACGEKVTEVIPKLDKLKNTMKVKTSKKTAKLADLKKKSVKVKPIKVKNARGKVRYKIAGGKKSAKKVLKLNKKNGKVTVKKGTKKGTYKLKIRVKAAGTYKYKSKTKKVTVIVKVR